MYQRNGFRLVEDIFLCKIRISYKYKFLKTTSDLNNEKCQ